MCLRCSHSAKADFKWSQLPASTLSNRKRWTVTFRQSHMCLHSRNVDFSTHHPFVSAGTTERYVLFGNGRMLSSMLFKGLFFCGLSQHGPAIELNIVLLF